MFQIEESWKGKYFAIKNKKMLALIRYPSMLSLVQYKMLALEWVTGLATCNMFDFFLISKDFSGHYKF